MRDNHATVAMVIENKLEAVLFFWQIFDCTRSNYDNNSEEYSKNYH